MLIYKKQTGCQKFKIYIEQLYNVEVIMCEVANNIVSLLPSMALLLFNIYVALLCKILH